MRPLSNSSSVVPPFISQAPADYCVLRFELAFSFYPGERHLSCSSQEERRIVNKQYFQLLTRRRGPPKYAEIRVKRLNQGWGITGGETHNDSQPSGEALPQAKKSMTIRKGNDRRPRRYWRILFWICGGGGQDRTADLRVMKTPISNTINYLHAAVDHQNTPKYV